MEEHQRLHVAHFEVNLLGITVLFLLLEQTSTILEDLLVSFLINYPADLYETLQVVLFYVNLNSLFVVLVRYVVLACLLPVIVGECPTGLLRNQV